MITFLLRYGEKYDLQNQLIYFLVNLINNNIIDFVSGKDGHDEFFTELSGLMFNEENAKVDVYSYNCYVFA